MLFFRTLLLLASFLHLAHALPQPPHFLARASSGCGKKAFLPGLVPFRTLKSSGMTRSYSFHLPSNYDINKPYPVVLGFHGSSSIGTFFEVDTKMSQARYSADKIMVYPNGVGGSWAGPTYHTGSTVAQDVQFVKDVIDAVRANFCVGESRMFAAG